MSAFSLGRPFRLMLFNPICLIADLYYAYIYGIIYVLIVTVPLLFAYDPEDPTLFHYGWSPSIVPLSYVGLGIGFFSAAFTAAQAQNRIYAYMCARNGDKGQPEYRVSSDLVPVGLSSQEAHVCRAPLVSQLVMTQIGMIFFPVGWFIYVSPTSLSLHHFLLSRTPR